MDYGNRLNRLTTSDQFFPGNLTPAERADMARAYKAIELGHECVEREIAAHAPAPVVLIVVKNPEKQNGDWGLCVTPMDHARDLVRKLHRLGLLSKTQADRVLTPAPPPGRARYIITAGNLVTTGVLRDWPADLPRPSSQGIVYRPAGWAGPTDGA
jgi:hypothetical protein